MVSVSGKVQSLSGKCPSLTFTVGSKTIVTDSSTDFAKFHCSDVKNGVAVSVSGTLQSNGTVRAAQVKKDD